MKKKILALGLVTILGCGQMMAVHADTMNDVKKQKAETSSQLESTKNKIDSLEGQKNQLTGEIDSLDAQLIQTIASVNELKDSIASKETEIEDTQVRLAASEEDRDQQYDAMKKRIQYLYENGGSGSWATILLEDGNISDLLSSVNQTQELYDYDKKALEDYAAVVQQVMDLGEQLETEKSDLQTMETEQEEEQRSLEGMLEQKKATCSDYESQIAAAEQVASRYQNLIKQQNVQIEELVAEQQRQAQEAAKLQAEEEAKQKAAPQANENKNKPDNNTPDKGSKNKPDNSTPDKGSDNKPDNNTPDKGNTDGDDKNDTGGGSGISGQTIVSYALQFVGNPYVWGGNSLTNGTDCSGFIHLIYAHFGYSVPRQSDDFRGKGKAVSYSEAQPGDVICYSGHVAIYMGGGQIVHAKNAASGIVSGDSATAGRTILAVRRYL